MFRSAPEGRHPGATVWFAASAAAHAGLAVLFWLTIHPATRNHARARPVVFDVQVEKPRVAKSVIPEPLRPVDKPAAAPASRPKRPVRSRPRRRPRARPAVAAVPITLIQNGEEPSPPPVYASPAPPEPRPVVAPPSAPALPEPKKNAARPRPKLQKNWGAVARKIRRSIRKHLRYPESARRRGSEGVVVVRFKVDPQGLAKPVQVNRSAGSTLDRAAVAAVRRAQPLPRYPDWVEIPLTFGLDD